MWIKRLGVLLMLIAFLVNPFSLGLAFSSDHHIDNPIIIALIICFEALLLFLGLRLYYTELYKEIVINKYVNNFVLFIISLLFCFAIVEISIRIAGNYDSDGQFSLGPRDLIPYVLPVNSMEEEIHFFENLTNPYIIPDPYLGWTTANNSNSLQPLGYYQTNSIGLRSEREFTVTKKNGTPRIALFGDSFVHSYDVSMNETMAFYLEKELSLTGFTEVMNFGVGGYGNDQAYLRWKLQGNEYNPDIVIIGFQAENCKRDVNIIRKFYSRGTVIPFSKPRFIMVNDSLVLVNYPTIPYKDVPSVVKDFERSSLSQYEHYYYAEDYTTNNLLFYSKAISYLLTILNENTEKKADPMNYEEGEEIRELCYSILKKFYNEASLNSTVYIVHLPTQEDLAMKMSSPQKDFVYEKLLFQLKNEFKVIDPTEDLIQEAQENTLGSLFVGHYSSKANEIVAKSIIKTIQNNTLDLTR